MGDFTLAAPGSPQTTDDFGSGGDGMMAHGGGGGAGFRSHHARRASSSDFGGAVAQEGSHLVPQNNGSVLIGGSESAYSSWSVQGPLDAEAADCAEGSPFIEGFAGGVIGPVAVLQAPNAHARSHSYGLGDWPPTDDGLDDGTDFLEGISHELPLSGVEIDACPDHHAF